MTLLDLLALALATNALVLAWLHEGGLFAECLLKIEAWGEYLPTDFEAGVPRWKPWLKHKIAFGLRCPFCLSYHVGFWLVLLCWVPGGLWMIPVYALAVTRLSIWFFKVMHGLHENS
jgi:hypothetical protein